MELFLKGLIAGFIIAVPMGPVSVLCFRRVLTGSLLVGLFTVFGAAAADMLYGLIVALGITFITHFIEAHKFWLRIFAGGFLLYFGLTMIRAHPDSVKGEGSSKLGVGKAFLSAFGLMIVNPVVVFSFFGVFSALELSAQHPGWVEGGLLALGLFSGSSSWWLVYKGANRVAGHALRKHGLHPINVATGSLICIFGCYEFIAAFLRKH